MTAEEAVKKYMDGIMDRIESYNIDSYDVQESFLAGATWQLNQCADIIEKINREISELQQKLISKGDK